jgi:hypothetical protein
LATCTREKGDHRVETRIDSVGLVEIGRKEFVLDSATSYQTLLMSVYRSASDERRYLVYENRIKQTVQFYDFETGLLWRELNYAREGPNGVGKLRGFYVHTLDSIYLMSSKYYQLILVDGSGNVLKRYPLINRGTQIANWSLPAIYTSRPAVLKSGVFYFIAFPESKPYEEQKPILTLNLADSACQLRYEYPDSYRVGDTWGMLTGDVSVTQTREGYFLYSFPCDPYLYETNDHQTNVKHFAGSRFFDKTQPWDKGVGDGAEEAYVTRNYFNGIVYDRFREVYYRFTKLELPVLNAQNEKNTIWNKPMSVIILNKEFQVIGETRLEQNKFDFRNWLVVEEGLLICNSNQHNPDVEEGKLKFTLFTLQTIEGK